jgi:hypothetical protein
LVVPLELFNVEFVYELALPSLRLAENVP